MPIPTFWEITDKEIDGEWFNPLERFIHDNEPAAGDPEAIFRRQLQAVVDFLAGLDVGEIEEYKS